VVLTLAADPSYRLSPTAALSTATVRITDNSSTVSITATKPLATELNGATTGYGQFTVMRIGGDLTKTLTVNYTVGGTAPNDGTDYTPVLPGTVTFAPGVTSAVIKFNPIDDFVAEGTQTVALTLVPDANPSYSISPRQTVATVTILDHNRPPVFTTVHTLAGATQNTTFAIPYATLLANTDAVDPEGVAITFKLSAVLSGTLQIDHGSGPVAAVPGTTLFGPGDTLLWTPAHNALGTLNAFMVAASDGVNVTPAKIVTVTVT
jgi:hypothetical protein